MEFFLVTFLAYSVDGNIAVMTRVSIGGLFKSDNCNSLVIK